ncbi:MAG: hypothetical protein LUC90_04965 [Lachnospiraceae bacterium]|nr:hypothetical protein [Lachnospiraceae bacterium]
MTAMDILEALGETGEELLCSCEENVREEEQGEDNASAAGVGEMNAIPDNDKITESRSDSRKTHGLYRLPFLRRTKYGWAAAGIAAAAAVFLLVYVVGGGYIGRSFDAGNTGRSESFSTQQSAEITADTAEAESAAEESETVEMEEGTAEEPETAEGAEEDTETTATTESSSETSGNSGAAAASGDEQEGSGTESGALTALQLGQVYIPGFVTSSLPEEEYAEMMALAELVQEEIDEALSAESMKTLPVYRFVGVGESSEVSGEEAAQTGMTYSSAADAIYVNLIEDLGDYPVITQEEAEEFLWQGYYLSPAGFSSEDTDSAEAASMELCYLVSPETLVYMPYYQFTVVIEEDMVYVCCVPAVDQEYLTGTLSNGEIQ